jgi:threonine/homoserine/homoserine lactone efflux protein
MKNERSRNSELRTRNPELRIPMQPFIAIFVSSFIIGFSGAMMPGTLLAVTISESSRRGPSAGPLLVLGHAMLELTLVTALILGLAPLFSRRIFFLSVSLAGGAVLLWMAYGMFRSLPRLSLSAAPARESGSHPVFSGILMSVVNPYWIIWWATIGLGYIVNAKRFGLTGVAVFFTGHILADLTWYSAVSFGIGKGRRFFNDTVYRILIGVCACALVFFASYFLYRAACVLPFFNVN